MKPSLTKCLISAAARKKRSAPITPQNLHVSVSITGRCWMGHCRQIWGLAAQERFSPEIPAVCCCRGLSSSLCTVTKGQEVSDCQLRLKRSQSESRKILVMVRTMKDSNGSPREDGESPSLEAFNNCVGQTKVCFAGKV